MRKHGWQLPYHPLQVVAVAVFLALGFAYYVFFAPFVGKKLFQYIAMGLYTPLILCVFGLYIWCAAADPADLGVFKSKKYLNIPQTKKLSQNQKSKHGRESTSSLQNDDSATAGGKSCHKIPKDDMATTADNCGSDTGQKIKAPQHSCWFTAMFTFIPCAYVCKCLSSKGESSEQQLSEDGMFYCSLCEVEVFKYSKHCRVCDKCVDNFDHHCRWLNNCIGKRNYRQFFTLMVSAIVMLIFQGSTGILVLIRSFIDHKKFSVDIGTKLGSSFTVAPFVIVVAVCTVLAMIATLPLAQLFFFHILLIKKGISTYDYIIALREQEQQGIGGQQSPQMSTRSSITGLSSASSFNTFQRGSWCTPPRLFVEDQFDVVPPETGSVSSWGKKMALDEPIKKKNPAPVKISPWALARLNAEEVSKAAAEARKKSKIIQPIKKLQPEPQNPFSTSSRRLTIPKPENNRRQKHFPNTSSSLGPLQLEPRSTFRTSGGISSSPESSLESPDQLEARQVSSPQKGIMPLSRSTSDGYDASGGEDSDRVPSRSVERMSNWGNILFNPIRDERVFREKGTGSSSGDVNSRKFF